MNRRPTDEEFETCLRDDGGCAEPLWTEARRARTREAALEAKCDLLAASLKKADKRAEQAESELAKVRAERDRTRGWLNGQTKLTAQVIGEREDLREKLAALEAKDQALWLAAWNARAKLYRSGGAGDEAARILGKAIAATTEPAATRGAPAVEIAPAVNIPAEHRVGVADCSCPACLSHSEPKGERR